MAFRFPAIGTQPPPARTARKYTVSFTQFACMYRFREIRTPDLWEVKVGQISGFAVRRERRRTHLIRQSQGGSRVVEFGIIELLQEVLNGAIRSWVCHVMNSDVESRARSDGADVS